jgi:aryl-alcohol dehydrogenase-like predicted oxidoreductase
MADTVSAARAGTISFGGLTVNRLGLGTNRIYDNEAGHSLLKRAVELGVNFIDTAHTYAGGESEAAIGNALAPFDEGLVVATKGGMGAGASPKQLRAELEESLKRLQATHIDLYQLHRIDPATPLAESLSALKQFRDEGLIGAIGLSEVSIDQLAEAAKVVPIASVQNEYNLANRKYNDVLEYCTANNIAFIPWYPLGGHHEDAAKVQALAEPLLKKYGATTQQIALAWLLKRSPMMLPIPGTTSPEHLESNLQAALIKLGDEDYAALTSGAA